MKEKEYRQHPAINRSALFKITENPEKFKYYMDNPEEPTPALLFGQLFHTMALQPEKLSEEFAVAPLVDRRTKEGKLAYNQFLIDNEGKVIIDENTFKTAKEMCDLRHIHRYNFQYFLCSSLQIFFSGVHSQFSSYDIHWS